MVTRLRVSGTSPGVEAVTSSLPLLRACPAAYRPGHGHRADPRCAPRWRTRRQ